MYAVTLPFPIHRFAFVFIHFQLHTYICILTLNAGIEISAYRVIVGKKDSSEVSEYCV